MKKHFHMILILFFSVSLLGAQDFYDSREEAELYRVKKNSRVSSARQEKTAVMHGDTIIYMTEHRGQGAKSPKRKGGDEWFPAIYQLKAGERQPSVFLDALVTEASDGPASFSSDGNLMVFGRQTGKGARYRDPKLELFFLSRENGGWNLPAQAFEHNASFAQLSTPALSSDGRNLFFAAKVESNEEDWDLFMSTRKGSSWSEPENLGPRINTEKYDEVFPFFHDPTQKLYFATRGFDNESEGFDLFQSHLVGKEWSRVTKLPEPFNSRRNDYHLWISDDMKQGYITSDRGGSSDIWGFQADIPEIEIPEPIRKTYYTYKIFDRKLDTVDTNLFRYSWVINDTLEIPGHEIIYRFPEPGTYVCKLNVFDIQLDTLVEGQTVKTLNIRLNEQAVITAPDTVRAGDPVTFDARSTHLPGVEIERFIWDFGDGTFGEGEVVQHRYTSAYDPAKVVLAVEERRRRGRSDQSDENSKARSNFKYVVVLPEN